MSQTTQPIEPALPEPWDPSHVGFGWRPDKKDHRDKQLGDMFDTQGNPPLPTKVDLVTTGHFSAPQNQLQTSSCVGQGVNGIYEYLMRKEHNLPFEGSALYCYYNARVLSGDVQSDNGTQIRDGFKGASLYGDCAQQLWDMSHRNEYSVRPPQAAFDDGSKRKMVKYYALDGTLTQLKQTLAQGFPVAFGITCVPTIMSEETASTGIIPPPTASDRVIGGHCILAVGYDDSKNQVKIRNSWGAGWGDHGYGYLDYEWINDARLSDSFWTCTLI